MKGILQSLNSFFTQQSIEQEEKPFPFHLEFIMAAFFLFVMGFLGTQKIIHVISDPTSAVNFKSINDSICSSGIRLPFTECLNPISLKKLQHLEEYESNEKPELLEKLESLNSLQEEQLEIDNETKNENENEKTTRKEIDKNIVKDIVTNIDIVDKYPLIQGMDESDNALPLREQFAYLPNLAAALNKLKWNEGNEQDAVRLLSVVSTLKYGRQREAHLEQSAMTRVLNPIWNSYPDLIAASHCLYCGQFFNNVLKPFMLEGTENKEHLSILAKAHPRFLNAIYTSGQIELGEINDLAKIQAELSSSGDANTAKFIGNILLKENEIDLLHHWSSKGWNGSYAISEYNKLIRLPQNIIVDAWQRGVSGGTDNAEITRYLISTGYRPALRWLLWFHSGNLSYFKKRQHQQAKDRYNNFLTEEYIQFPRESYRDLAGFYSKHWKDIRWEAASKKWVYKP